MSLIKKKLAHLYNMKYLQFYNTNQIQKSIHLFLSTYKGI